MATPIKGALSALNDKILARVREFDEDYDPTEHPRETAFGQFEVGHKMPDQPNVVVAIFKSPDERRIFAFAPDGDEFVRMTLDSSGMSVTTFGSEEGFVEAVGSEILGVPDDLGAAARAEVKEALDDIDLIKRAGDVGGETGSAALLAAEARLIGALESFVSAFAEEEEEEEEVPASGEVEPDAAASS
jgi:hypothetical protein